MNLQPAAFFVLQLGLGLGVASSRAPSPMRARPKSLVTHTVFGLGLFACALLARAVLWLGSTLLASPPPHYVFFAIVEIACTLFIAYHAWTWRVSESGW